jgi:hypothetical protein
LRTVALPDDGWCWQPKHLLVSNENEIFTVYIVVFIGQ